MSKCQRDFFTILSHEKEVKKPLLFTKIIFLPSKEVARKTKLEIRSVTDYTNKEMKNPRRSEFESARFRKSHGGVGKDSRSMGKGALINRVVPRPGCCKFSKKIQPR